MVFMKRCARGLAAVVWIAGLVCGPLLASAAAPDVTTVQASHGCHGQPAPAPAEPGAGRKACAIHCDAVAHALAAQAPVPAPPAPALAALPAAALPVASPSRGLTEAPGEVRGPPSRQLLHRKRSLLL